MLVKSAEVLESRPQNISLLTLSVSKAKTFKECQAKFKFAYIEKLPRKERDYHIFGKFLHEVLEKFHKELLNGNTDQNNIIMSKCFKSAYETFKEKLNADQIKESKEIITKYLKKLEYDKIFGKESQILSVEKEFYININDRILLNGFIDRIQLDYDNILHVGDYKTTLLLDKKNLEGMFTESEKYKRYKKDVFQLKTYAYVMMLEQPDLQEVRTSYIMLRHDFHQIDKVFKREEIMLMGDEFIKYADKIEEEKLYRPTVTPLCPYCEYAEKDICKPGFDYTEAQKEKANIGKSYGESNW
jgi:hypothetical protein